MAKKEPTAKSAPKTARSAKVLTNCTATPRAISLGAAGKLTLAPLEMRPLSDKEYSALKKLFASRTFQKFADNGIFRLSGMGADEQPVDVPVPQAPEDLTAPVAVDGVTTVVSTGSGTRAVSPRSAGSVVVS